MHLKLNSKIVLALKLFDELWCTADDTSLYELFEILSRSVCQVGK
jgi:hypothetical protein